MKKWNYLLSLLLLASAVFVSSCTKDETVNGPSLNLKGQSGYTSSDVTVPAGTDVTIGVIGTAGDKNLTRFVLTVINDNNPQDVVDTTFNSSTFNLDIALTFSASSVGENRINMTLTDKDGNQDTESFKVTVEAQTNVVKYEGVLLGSSNDTEPSFYSTTTNERFTVGQLTTNTTNQAKVDFLFFKKSEPDANVLASPRDPLANAVAIFKLNLWTNKNETYFNTTTITAAEFDAIGSTYVFDDFNTSAQKTSITALAEGQVVMFKTAEGKLGLVKVVDLRSRGDLAEFDVIVSE